jgi:carboxylate-amine ligase
MLDNRLEFYRNNCRRIPSVAGRVIPEVASSRAEYETKILRRIYRDIAPLDTEGVLCHEWLNARGAIARFDRDTIEIRVLDVQESPVADLAICDFIVSCVKHLAAQPPAPEIDERELAAILLDAIAEGRRTLIRNPAYLARLGCEHDQASIGDLLIHFRRLLANALLPESHEPLDLIISEGCLSERILAALQSDYSDSNIDRIYRGLADCLAEGELFRGFSLTR